MIDISLWKVVIGLWIFTRGIAKGKGTYTYTKMDLAMDATMLHGYSKFISLCYFYAVDKICVKVAGS